jgi:7,8-dihydroneopterin aldolase/epimerase/oxygenase
MWKKTNQIVSLRDIRIKAPVGVYDFEKQEGNEFSITISITADFAKSSLSDELGDTLDYAQVHQIVVDVMKNPANLLEHVAQNIVEKITLLDFSITKIFIQIKKLEPPLPTFVGASCFEMTYEFL